MPDDTRRLRILSVAVSVINMISSIAVIGYSLRALVDVSFTSPVTGSTLLTHGAQTMLVAGALSFTATPLGLFSVILQHHRLMTLYMSGTVCLASLAGLGGVLGFAFSQQMGGGRLEEWMRVGVQSEYGHPDGHHVTDAWDRMHKELACCGVHSPREWLQSTWFARQQHSPRRRLPSSCCPTCALIHEKFCSSFFSSEQTEELTDQQKICLQVSQSCSSADESLADEESCVGWKVAPPWWPPAAYMHDTGCVSVLSELLSFYSTRMQWMGFVHSALLFFSAATIVYIARSDDTYDPVRE